MVEVFGDIGNLSPELFEMTKAYFKDFSQLCIYTNLLGGVVWEDFEFEINRFVLQKKIQAITTETNFLVILFRLFYFIYLLLKDSFYKH